MTEMQPFPSFPRDNHKKPEGIDENISLEIPSRKRSCAAVSTPSACVNKAIHHIQDLEVKVEESFQQISLTSRVREAFRTKLLSQSLVIKGRSKNHGHLHQLSK
ncbi:hypothetical protein JRQ81_012693 [Phrynocephalus forsythii]|uniref:Uncharacterized protein n=1 Tax=Phrynocephalus forsythii TaxID=171643 RepID=A0A9Q0Y1K2_9SAUR|nr:hypothetical protein JRQ81_012693 [Phrynocephalus forsythii]